MHDELDAEFVNSTSAEKTDCEVSHRGHFDSVIRTSAATECRPGCDQHELQAFLVACHQAAVSIDTMARQLGFDRETIRIELMLGLESWRAARRRSADTLSVADLGRIVDCH